ncbi:DUF4304 domain-containing protein [Prosthecobacter vanneervenii]|uniref:DUF4304 domain-containing protein n=1 Tax=Prosthecobacter vanneervenii TaxID=48466 RepID=A0A7W8DL20_9BACT|nr:DUF4304 domain-containing protein [Prosthecobacter vanneervenii]MBB5033889.1 hypothetical protein [Prosthecobacter vanneervenii]
MPKPQDIIKAMVSSLHKEHLKGLGFGKTGTTWIRSLEWPQVINIQLSSFNSAEEAKFTINIGISIPPMRSAWGTPAVEGALKEYDCELRTRIGSLLPNKNDKWWDVTSGSDPEELMHEVSDDISDYALPWLNKLKTWEEVAAEFVRSKMFAKAALAYNFAGDLQAAETNMALAISEANPHALPKLKKLAQIWRMS